MSSIEMLCQNYNDYFYYKIILIETYMTYHANRFYAIYNNYMYIQLRIP